MGDTVEGWIRCERDGWQGWRNCMRCGLEVEVYLVAPLCRDALRVYHTKPGLASRWTIILLW